MPPAPAAALVGSMPGALQNQSSSPMMQGFAPTPQMTHDQVVPGAQMSISQQQIQVVQQPMSVAQMQVTGI